MSRALKEEVTFDRSHVTSVDWTSYPVVRSSDIPTQVDVVLLNHPEVPPGGRGRAGEPRDRRRDRQRDFRCDRRSRPSGAAHSRESQAALAAIEGDICDVGEAFDSREALIKPPSAAEAVRASNLLGSA